MRGLSPQSGAVPSVSVDEKAVPSVSVDERAVPSVSVDERAVPSVSVDERAVPSVGLSPRSVWMRGLSPQSGAVPSVSVDERAVLGWVSVDERAVLGWFGAEFRRFSLDRHKPGKFEDFYRLVVHTHRISNSDVTIGYADVHGDLLPINNDDNFCKAVSSANPLLRVFIQKRGTQWLDGWLVLFSNQF
ncbi:hypothetical protein P7K49_027835 [Saguinus oedipus]|uniref:PB1 domain-containing protein n=1 Tax=Saguinus oedipus TaxID=9490 RepID=A0ABQ9UAK2_SAGOE|nr:hypothetical protein P7K49_027835 [Saguinus oedipus]